MELRELFDEFPLSESDEAPPALQQLLRESLDVCDDWERAERLLLDARTMMPERLEILVALYKMYAYSNRFEQSLHLIDEALAQAASQGGFPCDWRHLDSDSADWRAARGPVRFYLYSLKATGFVRLRQGEVSQAYEVLQKLRELDRSDQVGGSVVFEMATRLLDDEVA